MDIIPNVIIIIRETMIDKVQLEVKNISKFFIKGDNLFSNITRSLGVGKNIEKVIALDNVSLTIKEREIVGLVGESGCGKSTLGRIIAGILPQTKGQILYKGVDYNKLSKDESLKIQMVFQDPFASLNPRIRIKKIIGEAPLLHKLVSKKDINQHVEKIMLQSGLDKEFLHRFPHQFSGGQRQRIGIARALAVFPHLLVCDEPVSALDVSIQAQIINLFMKIRKEMNISYLFISHDIGVIEHVSDRIIVMYLGRIVESGSTSDVINHPNHPYTQALLREAPKIKNYNQKFKPIEGEIPSPLNPPSGCHFHPRCPKAMDICKKIQPELKEISQNKFSACHLNNI